MIINHNIAALNTHRQMGSAQSAQMSSMEKLSSGLRINSAKDDAAGLSISEKMRGQIRGLDQASRNSQDAISLIQTAEGALSETHSILQRMRELSVQASNDTNTSDDRAELQKEVAQLVEEIDRIGNNTEFNSKKLLDGELSDQSKVRSLDTAALTAGGGVTSLKASSTSSLAAGTYSLDVVTNSKALNGLTDPHTTGLDAVAISADSDLAEGVYQVDVASAISSTGTVLNGSSITAANVADSELADGTYVFKITNATGGSEAGQLYKVDAAGVETAEGAVTSLAGSLGSTVTVEGVSFDIAATVTLNDSLSFSQSTEYTATLKDSAGVAIGAGVVVSPDDTNVKLGTATSGVSVDFGAAIAEGEASFGVKATGASTAILKDASNNVVTQQVINSDEKRVDLGSTGLSFTTGTLTDGKTTGIKVDVTTQDKALKVQIGANETQELKVGISDMRASSLAIDGVNLNSQSSAKAAITSIDTAIKSVSSERSKLGAVQNRLDHTINNLATSSQNLTAAESRIRDVDMAKEMMNQTRNSILAQASQAMLAQSNQMPQSVLQLLR